MCIVVLDNDECTGAWAGMSVLYSVMRRLGIPPSPVLFAKLIEETGAVRPGVRILFDLISKLKQNGKITRVVMCTAARNDNGWVMFLRQVLEIWYGSPFFDVVIDGNLIRQWHDSKGSPNSDVFGSVFKDMNMVRLKGPEEKVIMVDDRPGHILNGIALGVFPYGKDLNITALARAHIPAWNSDHELMFARDLSHDFNITRGVGTTLRTEEQWVAEMCVICARLYLLTTVDT